MKANEREIDKYKQSLGVIQTMRLSLRTVFLSRASGKLGTSPFPVPRRDRN